MSEKLDISWILRRQFCGQGSRCAAGVPALSADLHDQIWNRCVRIVETELSLIHRSELSLIHRCKTRCLGCLHKDDAVEMFAG